MRPLIVCGGASDPCQFHHLGELVQNLIYDLVLLSTFLATAAFAYAGFLLLTSGGNESKKNEAKDIFLKVLKGYLWILVAWVLIYTITRVLLLDEFTLLGS